MPESALNAVHDDDLEAYLDSLGLLSAVKEGKITCVACGETVSIGTVQAVVPRAETIGILCSSPACMVAFLSDLDAEQGAPVEGTDGDGA